MNEARLAVRRLYDFPDSGNGYKVRLALCQLGIPFEYAPVDILNGESRSDAFLARNPNGRIPLLELEDGSFLAESNAILFYLAEGTPLLPAERLARARALQWMCFEQYSHEPFIAVARFWLRHPEASDYRPDELAARQARGREALAVMERHLAGAAFFSGAHYGIADIALFAYTHVADQAGLELAPYPAVGRWLGRVREQPGHVAMDAAVGIAPA